MRKKSKLDLKDKATLLVAAIVMFFIAVIATLIVLAFVKWFSVMVFITVGGSLFIICCYELKRESTEQGKSPLVILGNHVFGEISSLFLITMRGITGVLAYALGFGVVLGIYYFLPNLINYFSNTQIFNWLRNGFLVGIYLIIPVLWYIWLAVKVNQYVFGDIDNSSPEHTAKHRDDDGVNTPDKAKSEHQEEKPL